MADKSKLADMLDSMLNDNAEEAQIAFHTYAKEKMQELINPTSPASDSIDDVQDEQD